MSLEEQVHPSHKLLSKEEVIQLRKDFIAPSLSIHYESVLPLKIVRGYGQYLYDENNQPYLDCINNVTHVGHCHPKVVEALTTQMSLLSCSVPDHPNLSLYSKHLLSYFPPPMNHVFYTTSGSEANDLALHICQVVTGGSEILVLDGGYHGHTQSLISLSSYKMKQQLNSSSPRIKPNPSVCVCDLPDSYRGKHQGDDAGPKYAKDVGNIIAGLTDEGKKIACFMAESFVSCGGQVKLPDNYLSEVFKMVRDAGGLCVADEVQTGFGRAGEYFWIFESQGVCPDIVTIGKPMGNGHPISAVVTSAEIATSYLEVVGPNCAADYLSDPASLAVAEAVLCIIEEEKLQNNAREVGGYLLQNFRSMMSRYPCIGDVRGYGLFIGIELVKDRSTKEPDGKLCKEIVHRVLLKERVLIQAEGLDGNVIKLKPPITFTMEDATKLLTALENSFKELS